MSIDNRMVCCSVIVTYNRKELLSRCLEYNLKQTIKQDILIIDNASTDGTYEYLCQKGYIINERIKYIRNKVNEFGAGGFYRGLSEVFSRGYQYAWLMDDDGYPLYENTLQKLIEEAYHVQNKCIMLNSLVLCNKNTLTFVLDGMSTVTEVKRINDGDKRTVLKGYISPFNGTLISKETFEKIGNIRKEMLIHGDEVEYRERAKEGGVIVGTVLDSFFYHPLRYRGEYCIWKNKEFLLRYTPHWMEYYETRNYIYIKRKYGNKEDVRQYLMELYAKICCTKKNRIKYGSYILRGIIAGMQEDFRPLKMHKYLKETL